MGQLFWFTSVKPIKCEFVGFTYVNKTAGHLRKILREIPNVYYFRQNIPAFSLYEYNLYSTVMIWFLDTTAFFVN